MGAIARRIAFSTLKDFVSDYRNMDFLYSLKTSSEDILTWLGDSPALLLINELNAFTSPEPQEALWEFL